MGNVVSLILMIGVIIAGLIVIGLSITTIVSRINERREDIEREHEERKRAKLAAKAARAAEEGVGGDATSGDAGVGGDRTVAINAAAQKTMAIEDNKGKNIIILGYILHISFCLQPFYRLFQCFYCLCLQHTT